MALIHVLAADRSGLFSCVLHVAVPTGSNAAGTTWKDAFLASGRSGRTVMTEGLLAGQITTAEKAQIAAGDIVEFVFEMNAERGGGTLADVQATLLADASAFRAIANGTLDSWKTALRLWGAVKA